MGIYARQTTATTPLPPSTTAAPPTTAQPPPTTSQPNTPTTRPIGPPGGPGGPGGPQGPPGQPTDTNTEIETTSTTPTSTTSSTPTSTSSTTSIPLATLPTSTRTSTSVVTVGPSIAPTIAPGGNSNSNGFFGNKGAVIATFTVVGLAVLIFAFFVVSNCMRRRRARKFDQEVANAAADAYADADRAHSWTDDDDHWNEGRRPYGAAAPAPHMQDSYSAYRDPQMTQVPPPAAPYANYGSNGSEEFPTRGANAAPQSYPYNNTDPFKDPRAGFAPGSIIPQNFSPGVAGVGAGGVTRAASIKHPFANVNPVESGISYDSGPYPVPAHRRSSMQQRQGSVSTPGRSGSISSGGHSLSQNSSNSGQAQPQAPLPRLPRTTEDQDDSPYDGVSDLPNPYANDFPRSLRVANA